MRKLVAVSRSRKVVSQNNKAKLASVNFLKFYLFIGGRSLCSVVYCSVLMSHIRVLQFGTTVILIQMKQLHFVYV